jgi:hypothetical protein
LSDYKEKADKAFGKALDKVDPNTGELSEDEVRELFVKLGFSPIISALPDDEEMPTELKLEYADGTKETLDLKEIFDSGIFNNEE